MCMNSRGITLRRYLTQPAPSTVKSASRANTDQQAREVFEQLEPPRSYRSCPHLCFFIRNSDLEPLDGSHSRDTMRSIITVSRVMELQTINLPHVHVKTSDGTHICKGLSPKAYVTLDGHLVVNSQNLGEVKFKSALSLMEWTSSAGPRRSAV